VRKHGKGLKFPIFRIFCVWPDWSSSTAEVKMRQSLHDAVEDQGGQLTLERIRRRFGSEAEVSRETCPAGER
jgi:hypothetical protein